MGGARMADAGMDLLVDVTAAAVAGGTEALNRIPVFYRAYRRLRGALDGAHRPRVLVVIDSPEFNLRLARAARRAGVPVVYFIPPQVWGGRAGGRQKTPPLGSPRAAGLPFPAAPYRRAGGPA